MHDSSEQTAVSPDPAPDLTPDSPVALDDHWAVRVLSAERAAILLAEADRRLRTLERRPTEPLPPLEANVADDLLTLAGAYEIAAREALGRDDVASSAAQTPLGAREARLVHDGAARAFVLQSALPLSQDDPIESLYRTLMLRALSVVGERDAEFEYWFAAHRVLVVATERDPLDIALLRAAVAIWVDVLTGRGPSGLDSAASRIAQARESLTVERGPFLAASPTQDERVRREFALFALARLIDSATEVLLARTHEERSDAADRIHLALALVAPAAAGTRALASALVWLEEAAGRVLRERSTQLELLA